MPENRSKLTPIFVPDSAAAKPNNKKSWFRRMRDYYRENYRNLPFYKKPIAMVRDLFSAVKKAIWPVIKQFLDAFWAIVDYLKFDRISKTLNNSARLVVLIDLIVSTAFLVKDIFLTAAYIVPLTVAAVLCMISKSGQEFAEKCLLRVYDISNNSITVAAISLTAVALVGLALQFAGVAPVLHVIFVMAEPIRFFSVVLGMAATFWDNKFEKSREFFNRQLNKLSTKFDKVRDFFNDKFAKWNLLGRAEPKEDFHLLPIEELEYISNKKDLSEQNDTESVPLVTTPPLEDNLYSPSPDINAPENVEITNVERGIKTAGAIVAGVAPLILGATCPALILAFAGGSTFFGSLYDYKRAKKGDPLVPTVGLQDNQISRNPNPSPSTFSALGI